MKVKVIASKHGHIQIGMIGTCSTDFWKAKLKYLEVQFKGIENMTTHKEENPIVIMERKELEAVDDN